VKNRVLSFALDIERESPNAGDGKPGQASSLSNERVTQIFNVTVMGGTNNIAAGSSDFSQNINVAKGDIESLRKSLTAHGVTEEDVNEIAAIATEEKPHGNTLGNKALAWVGKMSAKAIEGLWSGSIAGGTEVLTKALLAYYGLLP